MLVTTHRTTGHPGPLLTATLPAMGAMASVALMPSLAILGLMAMDLGLMDMDLGLMAMVLGLMDMDLV